MAGSLYLGSQKVCPAILLGGGESVRNGLEPDQDGKLSWVKSGNLVFSGFTDIGESIFYQRFAESEITSVDLSNLETISGNQACNNMFYFCSQLISADLSSLKIVTGNNACNGMFIGCSQLTSVDLSSLETISGNYSCANMFYSCPQITSVDLSNLKTISGNHACDGMFADCPQLTSVDLSVLETISGSLVCCRNMFYMCDLLKYLSFPSLKTIPNTKAFSGLIIDCSGVTIHFPSNMESTIQGLTGYPNFGGTDTTLLFDLPPTA